MESFLAHLERWAHRIKVSLVSLFVVTCVDGCGLKFLFGVWDLLTYVGWVGEDVAY